MDILSRDYHNLRLFNDELPTNDLYYQGARRAFSGNWQTLLRFENFIASSAILYRADVLGRRGYNANRGIDLSPTFISSSVWAGSARSAIWTRSPGPTGGTDKVRPAPSPISGAGSGSGGKRAQSP